jgi:hypothetical protein
MPQPFLSEVVPGKEPNSAAKNQFPEGAITLPWGIDPATSWLDYRCWVECHLDAGMALHKPLPQSNPAVDTLASVGIADINADKLTTDSGVNLDSLAGQNDVIQRMASSTYRFVLLGWGLRVGYQIPIPGIIKIGNVVPVPGRIQRAYNVVVSNFAGIPTWFATWELHYLVTGLPAESQAPVPFNPALHVRPDAQLPKSVKLPWTQPDQAQIVQTVPNLGFITR